MSRPPPPGVPTGPALLLYTQKVVNENQKLFERVTEHESDIASLKRNVEGDYQQQLRDLQRRLDVVESDHRKLDAMLEQAVQAGIDRRDKGIAESLNDLVKEDGRLRESVQSIDARLGRVQDSAEAGVHEQSVFLTKEQASVITARVEACEKCLSDKKHPDPGLIERIQALESAFDTSIGTSQAACKAQTSGPCHDRPLQGQRMEMPKSTEKCAESQLYPGTIRQASQMQAVHEAFYQPQGSGSRVEETPPGGIDIEMDRQEPGQHYEKPSRCAGTKTDIALHFPDAATAGSMSSEDLMYTPSERRNDGRISCTEGAAIADLWTSPERNQVKKRALEDRRYDFPDPKSLQEPKDLSQQSIGIQRARRNLGGQRESRVCERPHGGMTATSKAMEDQDQAELGQENSRRVARSPANVQVEERAGRRHSSEDRDLSRAPEYHWSNADQTKKRIGSRARRRVDMDARELKMIGDFQGPQKRAPGEASMQKLNLKKSTRSGRTWSNSKVDQGKGVSGATVNIKGRRLIFTIKHPSLRKVSADYAGKANASKKHCAQPQDEDQPVKRRRIKQRC